MESIVVRGAGDSYGQDIEEPLLATRPAQVARGQKELDAQAHAKKSVDLSILYRENLRLGQLVQVADEAQGKTYRGKITSIALRLGSAAELGKEADITLEVPTEFYQ